MAIDTQTLNQLIFDAFTGKLTWLDASNRYPLEDLVVAFRNARASMHRLLEDLTDAQVGYHDPSSPIWSISETITHLIFSQHFYHNSLLDITNSERPHIAEAARGFGEGAQQHIPANTLRTMLKDATTQIVEVIADTRSTVDPARTTRNPFFGVMAYQTWILTMLGHEVDHLRQAIVMRRLAKAAQPN